MDETRHRSADRPAASFAADRADAAGADAVSASLGPELLARFYALLRTARSHGVANQAFQRQVEEFLAAAAPLLGSDGEFALSLTGGRFYVDGRRVTMPQFLLSTQAALKAELEQRKLGGLRFRAGVTPEQVRHFLRLFLAVGSATASTPLDRALLEAGVDTIELIEEAQARPGSEDSALEHSLPDPFSASTEEERARQAYAGAVRRTRRLLLRASRQGYADMRSVQRIVHPVVDLITRNQYSIVGLTAIKEHDDYTFAHSVNVAVLSIGIGQALGLSRQDLADLGVTALLHDIGKITVSSEILRKPGALSEQEWARMRGHPLEGALIIARMPGISRLMLEAMRVCLEHHLNRDLSGYPATPKAWEQGMMTRIVSVADYFDALTAHRVYRQRPWSPYEALQMARERANGAFDPVVVWALIRTVGVYPTGTVFATRSGRLLRVVSPNPQDPNRPVCRPFVPTDTLHGAGEGEMETGVALPEGEVVVRVLNPDEYPMEGNRRQAA